MLHADEKSLHVTEVDEFFLDELADQSYCLPNGRERILSWLAREGSPLESMITTLTEKGLLYPWAERVIHVSWQGALRLPHLRKCFTPDGETWLRLHFARGFRKNVRESDHPSKLTDTALGLTISDNSDTVTIALGRNPIPSDHLAHINPALGVYQLLYVLSKSEKQIVFQAENFLTGGSPIALKLIASSNSAEIALAQQYLDGADLARRLNLTGCLPVISSVREFDVTCLVMPLVPEGSVQDLQAKVLVSPFKATTICASAARNLAAVHREGWAHGNIKASNLMISAQDILLSDFVLTGDVRVEPGETFSTQQEDDISSLVKVYSELLQAGYRKSQSGRSSTDSTMVIPAICRNIILQKHASAEALADALDRAAVSLSPKSISQGVSRISVATDKPSGIGTRMPAVGDILGKCRLTRQIGQGATGVVFLATHQSLGIDVAVKVLSSVGQCHQTLREQFTQEARMLAQLNNPNIVRIWDFESGSEFPPYLVLELVDGQTLDERIAERGLLPANEAVPLFTQVISALKTANRQTGLVHRDIKPANILLGKDGSVKVADLGLASIFDNEKDLTATLAGTPAYMSPEQMRGSKAADLRSDIYSLGATLYQTVTGYLPFQAKSRTAMILKHIQEAPIPPDQRYPGVPASLSQIILQMLEKQPEDRFQNYDDLLTALADPRVVSVVDARPIRISEAALLDTTPEVKMSDTTSTAAVEALPATSSPTASSSIQKIATLWRRLSR